MTGTRVTTTAEADCDWSSCISLCSDPSPFCQEAMSALRTTFNHATVFDDRINGRQTSNLRYAWQRSVLPGVPTRGDRMKPCWLARGRASRKDLFTVTAAQDYRCACTARELLVNATSRRDCAGSKVRSDVCAQRGAPKRLARTVDCV